MQVKKVKGVVEVLCAFIFIILVIILLAPAISNLQTISRGKEIVDNAKEGDIDKTVDDTSDFLVDTTLGELWSALWAPILALVVSFLIALLVFLKKGISFS